MRNRLTILLLFAVSMSAAAQFPVYIEGPYPGPRPPAEIRFTDGTSGVYPVVRITKDLMRINLETDQSRRVPLTFVESMTFRDGCTLFFRDGEFQFDKLVQPARIRNESGDVLLEGVLQLTKPQAESLMGPEYYRQFRKHSRILMAGGITMMVGTAMLVPYLGTAIADHSPADAFRDIAPAWKGVTLGGCGVLLAGAVIAFIGNSGCNRVAASYNNGLGLVYSF